MTRTAAIVGGGVAGLAAGVELARHGVRVRLHERRPILGGRASSYESPGGHVVDNGQHVLMGCYEKTLGFLARIGSLDRVSFQERLSVPLIHPERGTAELRAGGGPAPLHLVAAALRYRHLGWTGAIGGLAGGAALAFGWRVGPDETVADALDRLGQPTDVREAFWNPLAIAVLNETPERASARLFSTVLRRVFLGPPNASRVVFPECGLSDLYATPARETIESLGGAVTPRSRVRSIDVDAGGARGLRLAGGETEPADAVILAVPPDEARRLLPESAGSELAAKIAALEPSPIVSIHLWLAEPVETPRMVGFVDPTIHWLFTPPMQPDAGRYVTLVSSGCRELAGRDARAIVATTVERLRRFLPAVADATIVDSVVTKEREATWAATPREQPSRPANATPIPNLFLAGDWTDTGLPGTIESAVESGERAARLALSQPERSVEPRRVSRAA